MPAIDLPINKATRKNKRLAKIIGTVLGIVNALGGFGNGYADLRHLQYNPDVSLCLALLWGAICGGFAYGIVMLTYHIIHWGLRGMKKFNVILKIIGIVLLLYFWFAFVLALVHTIGVEISGMLKAILGR